MPQRTTIATAVVIAFAAALYQLGFFDWPSFEEATLEPKLYVLLASTTSKDIAGSVDRLLGGTREAIEKVGKDLLAPAAVAYGAPKGAEALSVGLHFDNPCTSDHPRWALGWAIQVDDKKLLPDIHAQVSQASTLDEPIRLVALGGGYKILTARIPWRTRLTPMLAPRLHWRRAFKVYQEVGYKSTSGREGDGGDIACEVYVTGPQNSFEYIDYTLIMGDTSAIFDAMFPLETKTQEEETKEVQHKTEQKDEHGEAEELEESAVTE